MGISLTELVKALDMAWQLPTLAAIPFFAIGYCAALWCVIAVLEKAAKAYSAWKKAMKDE